MKKQKASFIPPEKAKVMKPKKYEPQGIKIQRISYIGNADTNKYKNNVRIYVQPFFDSTDILSVVDLKKKISYSNVNVIDIHCGKYTYQRISSSVFGKHTGMDCMMMPVEHRRSGMLNTKINKYIIYSTNNTGKKPVLMVILDNDFYESVLKI